jgi:hypothetical protein
MEIKKAIYKIDKQDADYLLGMLEGLEWSAMEADKHKLSEALGNLRERLRDTLRDGGIE